MSNYNLVTIIIPVYNVEKYLKKCLDSVINQTYKNIEIILINDGSSDKSADICREYEKKDSRVIFINKKNEGVSAARNTGIENANGKYISFIDSDDWVELNFIEILYTNMIEKDIDLSMCGYYKNYENGREKFKNTTSYTLDKKMIFKDIWIKDIFWSYSINKLYKADLIKQNCLYFDCSIAIGEDTKFICEYIQYIENSYYDNRPLYHYFQRSDSVINLKSFKNNNLTVIKVYEFVIDLYLKLGMEYVYLAKENYIKGVTDCRYRMYLSKFPEVKILDNYRKISKKYYNEIKMFYGIRKRMEVFLAAYFPILYGKVKGIYKKLT